MSFISILEKYVCDKYVDSRCLLRPIMTYNPYLFYDRYRYPANLV